MKTFLNTVKNAFRFLFARKHPAAETEKPAEVRREQYRNLVSRLAQSEIDLGLTFAGAAESAYRAGRSALGETAHARAEIQYSKASRLADECPSSDREGILGDLLRLSKAIDSLRTYRDEIES